MPPTITIAHAPSASRALTPSRAVLQRKCSCGGNAPAGGECEECKKKKKLQRKSIGGVLPGADAAVDSVLSSPGEPLDAGTRSFLENGFAGARPRVAPGAVMQGKLAISPQTDPAEAEADRFSERALAGGDAQAAPGSAPDLSGIRIHTDAAAGRSAASVGARAYTVGNHIVFGAGQMNPHSREGRGLIAHEAAHVMQQGSQHVIQRQVPPDPCKEKKAEVVGHKVYKQIRRRFDDTARELREIVTMAEEGTTCVDDLTKVVLLLDTPDPEKLDPKDPVAKADLETNVKDSRQAGIQSASEEATRLGGGEGKARADEEKNAGAGVKFEKRQGDGATYGLYMNGYTNIMVKVKVRLKAANGKKMKAPLATDSTDVDNIKALKDATEKAASTLGYTLLLDFVENYGSDVFQAKVDLGDWTNSGNWVSKTPGRDHGLVLAHELHHRLGLRDRYDYKGHAGNKKMTRADRIHWFHFTMLEKGWVDPLRHESLMGQGDVLVSDDICRVALNLKGEHQIDDDKRLDKNPALKAKFEECMAARKDLADKAADPAQAAAGMAVQRLKWKVNTGILPENSGEAHSDALRPKGSPTMAEMRETTLLGRAKALIGESFTGPELLAALDHIHTLTGAVVKIASNRDPACAEDDGKSNGGRAPIFLCPTFYAMSLPAQTNIILRHAAAIHAGTSPSRAGTCSSYDCSTQCAGDADRWVHFIRCANQP